MQLILTNSMMIIHSIKVPSQRYPFYKIYYGIILVCLECLQNLLLLTKTIKDIHLSKQLKHVKTAYV